ncbi:MAG: protein TonB [Granulosicoccus sp.]|jgi:protein TonB
MKKIIAFLFLSILFQNFTFCQKTEELESTTDSLKLEKPTEEKIFKVVKNVYRFPGCEGQGLSKEELKKCSDQEMMKFIYSWIKYPAKARENGTEGNVEVQFTVLCDGSVRDIKILKDIGNGCGEEVARIIELMNHMGQKWTGCKSRGKPYKLKIKIAVQFELKSEDEPSKFSEDYKLDESYALEYPIEVIAYPPKTEEPEEEKNFKVINDLPRFPGCEGRGKSKKELKECSDNEMLKFIYSNLKYPGKARAEKTEGRVIAQFTVFRDGSVGNVKILRDIGNGCGEEAKRVILLMNDMPQKWIPGRSRGKPFTPVDFTLPVSFKLQG